MFYEIKGVLMSDTITDLVKSVTYDAGRHCGSSENEHPNSCTLVNDVTPTFEK